MIGKSEKISMHDSIFCHIYPFSEYDYEMLLQLYTNLKLKRSVKEGWMI